MHSRLRKLIVLCALAGLSPPALADILLFKRTTDVIRPVKGEREVQVWLTDAPNLLLAPINAEGRDIFDETAQRAFIQSIAERIDQEQLKLLVLVSLVSKAKMEKFGITRLPTVVQTDRDGTVVRKVVGVKSIEEFLRWY